VSEIASYSVQVALIASGGSQPISGFAINPQSNCYRAISPKRRSCYQTRTKPPNLAIGAAICTYDIAQEVASYPDFS